MAACRRELRDSALWPERVCGNRMLDRVRFLEPRHPSRDRAKLTESDCLTDPQAMSVEHHTSRWSRIPCRPRLGLEQLVHGDRPSARQYPTAVPQGVRIDVREAGIPRDRADLVVDGLALEVNQGFQWHTMKATRRRKVKSVASDGSFEAALRSA